MLSSPLLQGATPATTSHVEATTAAWLGENPLDDPAMPLELGQHLAALTTRVDPRIRSALQGLRVGTAPVTRTVVPEAAHDTPASVLTRGTVIALHAVSARHLIGPGGDCLPNLRSVRSRPVGSTRESLLERSVWLPSGAHALIGFLLEIQRH